MRISNFEHTGLDKVELLIEKNKIKYLDEKTIKEILKTTNISFVAEGIDRIQSTLLCELKDSYVQQSQRYVTMKEDSYKLPVLDDEDNKKAKELTEKLFKLYETMSQMKDGNFKGRPKINNYKYEIPIEDARYILPLATKTNVCVAMTGDKLYELFLLINDKRYLSIFTELREEISKILPNKLAHLLPNSYDGGKDKDIIQSLYTKDMDKINHEKNMVLLNCFENIDLKVGLGALTSTQARTVSETLIKWGEEAIDKAEGVVERVLGYGHDSIAEQARTTFGMMCSMVTYHQQIRHRLSQNHREDLDNIIIKKDRPIVVPKSIEKSIFFNEYYKLTDEYKKFRVYVFEKYGQDKAYPFILNCDQIKFIISTNARIDTEMLAERTCMNAQWEIRELATKKLMILRKKSNVLYENALPSCVFGKCKEGKLSCGSQSEMREKFR
ncbi:FAD-dependent thymidylate synthase [Clostridium sp. DL1XJH146]